ncbi:hypothetical protein KXD40_007317 [Peronospora effusa]|uniref:Uncharacterized protein n=1 Tax=Peronospora effusa TaxID=542832 RepID=A0A3M6VSU1_9STRA|nr:hypothetical protein DD238_005609 [Peronospora effusa]UIZ28789.1 hypothetical protein KXD40_007317 [Peronospora effusa]
MTHLITATPSSRMSELEAHRQQLAAPHLFSQKNELTEFLATHADVTTKTKASGRFFPRTFDLSHRNHHLQPGYASDSEQAG